MKRWLLVAAGVVVLGAIVIANLVHSRGDSVKVRLATVERGDITSRVSAPGRVQAASTVNISAEVPGRIEKLLVAEGDSVSRGQVLLRLDDSQYRSRVAQASAALRSARANLELARARLEKIKKDKERLEALRARDLASEDAVEKAATDYRVQQAQVDARREELERLKAALMDRKDDLEKTEYRAPVSGIVSRLNVKEGEIVVVGTMNNPGTVILTIADLSLMEVKAEVDETDVVQVAPGQKAKISVDALPDTSFAGTVASVGSSGRSSGRGTTDEAVNFEVKVRFDHADPRIKPGMTADVDIETQTHENVLTVPIQALVARSQATLDRDRRLARMKKKRGKVQAPDSAAAEADSLSESEREERNKKIVEGVYKVVDGEVTFVPVVSGLADDTRIEVRGDLQEGDKVVSGPYLVLRDLKEGTAVREMKRNRGKKEKK